MHEGRNTLVLATRFIRKLRGGSQPVLIEASDGKKYVIKFPNNLQGPNVLCNEVLGTELYRSIGLPAPGWRPILITQQFLNENPACRIEDVNGWVEPNAGLSFGSELIGEPTSSLFEILPEPYWAGVANRPDFWLAWLVDLCAEHWDNRQAVFVQTNGRLTAVFVDHGHMFGGPCGSRRTPVLGPRHLDRRAYVELDRDSRLKLRNVCATIKPDELLKKIALIPEQWATGSAVKNFLACIERLSKAEIWQSKLEAILASFKFPDRCDDSPHPRQCFALLATARNVRAKRSYLKVGAMWIGAFWTGAFWISASINASWISSC